MRRKIVAGNWKMNKTATETTKLIKELAEVTKSDDVDVVICPTAVCIPAAIEAAKGSNIEIGAQNMFYEEDGAYTGEVAPNMLTDLGVKYVIIGHSERRQYFGETDYTVNKKVLKAIEHDLIPMICVGETLKQREQGITLDLIRTQVKVALNNVKAEEAANLIIAYEPIWAIGTGETATSEQAEEVCAVVRQSVKEVYNEDVSEKVRIQYGGSVNPSNANELFNMGNIDGGLVGGASLTVDFGDVVNYK